MKVGRRVSIGRKVPAAQGCLFVLPGDVGRAGDATGWFDAKEMV